VKPLALVLAVVFFIIAVLYLVGVLQIGVSHPGGRHVSHFVLFAVLGALCLVWMRFQGAPQTRLR
jgi:type VI protein secretion system component VasK